jgi:hypothetical protein
MAEKKIKTAYDKEQKEGTAAKKSMPNQPELILGNSGCVNLNIFLSRQQKSDDKKGGKYGGIASDKGAAMDGDKADSDAVLTINIYL